MMRRRAWAGGTRRCCLRRSRPRGIWRSSMLYVACLVVVVYPCNDLGCARSGLGTTTSRASRTSPPTPARTTSASPNAGSPTSPPTSSTSSPATSTCVPSLSPPFPSSPPLTSLSSHLFLLSTGHGQRTQHYTLHTPQHAPTYPSFLRHLYLLELRPVYVADPCFFEDEERPWRRARAKVWQPVFALCFPGRDGVGCVLETEACRVEGERVREEVEAFIRAEVGGEGDEAMDVDADGDEAAAGVEQPAAGPSNVPPQPQPPVETPPPPPSHTGNHSESQPRRGHGTFTSQTNAQAEAGPSTSTGTQPQTFGFGFVQYEPPQ